MSAEPRSSVPAVRRRLLVDRPVEPRGRFVLYWMNAARRAAWNYALDHAIDQARALGLPVLVLEALRCDYRWASDRHHRFLLQGMAANRAAFRDSPIRHHAWVEPEAGAGRGLLRSLAERAALVVTDDFPGFFLPRMLARAAEEVPVRMEAVDSNGLFPLRATQRVFRRAVDFRRLLQRELPPHLARPPRSRPLARLDLPRLQRLPAGIAARWPEASERSLAGEAAELAELPIDHAVGAVDTEGGARAGERRLQRFLDAALVRYDESRNQLTPDATSGLSPYLHYGHVSPHRVLAALGAQEGWSLESLECGGRGAREGWWGMTPAAESFLDQLVTWRELGLNAAAHEPDHDGWDSLPEWARRTLAEHASDERPHLYGPAALERARTHDELWNAAQRALRATGTMPGYLRMLWGKKVLHWSRDPRAAHRLLVELNDRYALDGRDPNSASAILWVFGKYDRPWGPERPVFGKVRYMSSANARRKLRGLTEFLRLQRG